MKVIMAFKGGDIPGVRRFGDCWCMGSRTTYAIKSLR